jgi:deoxyhypusine synthase
MGPGPMKRKIDDLQVGPDMSAAELVDQLGRSGVFGAGRVSKAVEIVEKMITSNAEVYLGLAGAMVPAGMRRLFAEMIRDGMVDVLVSTGANMTHDLMCAFGAPQWRGLPLTDDGDLKEMGISRIYDSFIEEDAFQTFEKRISGMLKEILASKERVQITPSELLREIGNRVEDDASIVANAARRNVPIYVPAFTDSILGMQTFFFSQTNKMGIEVLRDLGSMIHRSCSADPSGALLVGGGVPKNFILQSKLVAPKGFDYTVQVTTDRPEPGGLSGATLEEAVSWGKVNPEGLAVTVYADATIVLPLIIAAVREELGDFLPRGGRR